jgi:uncharacterized protein (TIGR02646 family)
VIPVDTNRLVYLLPPGWLTKAAELQKKLDEAAGPEEAAKILENGHWGKLNKMLREASNQKCWYSETRPAAASRMDVDHFRPKGEVRESDKSKRPGYPFLAYDFRNYRLSAQLMNQSTNEGEGSRGKHNQFPLLAGSPAASCIGEVGDEKPLLLDPTVPGDPGLLTFDEQGEAKPSVESNREPIGHERAERTIEVLWLDRPLLRDDRKTAWRDAHEAIGRAQRFERAARNLTAAGERQEAAIEWRYFRKELTRLREHAASRSQHSAVVRTRLRIGGPPWAGLIAERAARTPLVIGPDST